MFSSLIKSKLSLSFLCFHQNKTTHKLKYITYFSELKNIIEEFYNEQRLNHSNVYA